MFCPKCQTQNDNQASFCSSCGTQLNIATVPTGTQESKITPNSEAVASQSATQTPVASGNTGAPIAQMANTTNTANVTNTANATNAINIANIANKINSSGVQNILLVIKDMIRKPITAVKEELPKIETLKDATIIGLLCTLAATAFSALTTILNAVWTETYDSVSGGSKMVFELSNLEHIDLLGIVGKRFLISLIVVFATGGVLMGLASVFKGAKASYARMLAIYAVSVVPAAICAFAGSIVSRIDSTVASIIGDAGVLYGSLMLYEGANLEAKIKDNKKVYYTVAVVALAAGITYIASRIIYGS
jgi:hypothetical protein